MAKSTAGTLGNTLARWVNAIRRLAPWVLGPATLGTGGALCYTGNNLGIKTHTADMLSETLHFRYLHTGYKRTSPQCEDTFLIVVEGVTPNPAQDISLALAHPLKGDRV